MSRELRGLELELERSVRLLGESVDELSSAAAPREGVWQMVALRAEVEATLNRLTELIHRVRQDLQSVDAWGREGEWTPEGKVAPLLRADPDEEAAEIAARLATLGRNEQGWWSRAAIAAAPRVWRVPSGKKCPHCDCGMVPVETGTSDPSWVPCESCKVE